MPLNLEKYKAPFWVPCIPFARQLSLSINSMHRAAYKGGYMDEDFSKI
jgi:hypothetical protein